MHKSVQLIDLIIYVCHDAQWKFFLKKFFSVVFFFLIKKLKIKQKIFIKDKKVFKKNSA
jgi:hypothetical protein